MAAARYSWRPGARISINAQAAGKELASIEAREGGLEPEAVVERARSSNSALHGHFEWDDSKAAEQHRLSQAGELIRAIVVDVSRSNVAPPKPIRAFVSVERESKRSYVSTATAMSDTALRKQVLMKAWEEFEALRRKYQELTELAAVFTAIDRARPAA